MGTAGLDGFMKVVNPAWSRMLGWSDEELLRRPFLDIVHPDDHAETAEVVARLARSETVTGFVDHVRTRDGEHRTIMWTAVPDPGTACSTSSGATSPTSTGPRSSCANRRRWRRWAS